MDESKKKESNVYEICGSDHGRSSFSILSDVLEIAQDSVQSGKKPDDGAVKDPLGL